MFYKISLALGEIRALFIFRREAGYKTQLLQKADQISHIVAQKLLKKQVKAKKE